jgi:hypothetical protein
MVTQGADTRVPLQVRASTGLLYELPGSTVSLFSFPNIYLSKKRTGSGYLQSECDIKNEVSSLFSVQAKSETSLKKAVRALE